MTLRRAFLAAGLLLGGLSCWRGTALSVTQEARVLVISPANTPPYSLVVDGFRQSFTAAGRRVAYEIVHLEEVPAADLKGLVEKKPGEIDLCLALGSRAVEVAVEADFGAPVLAGLTLRGSATPSGRKVAAGVDLEFPLRQQLELLRKVLPRARVAGVIYNPLENGPYVEEALTVASGLGLEILPLPVDRPRDIPQALKIAASRADVLWGIPDTIVMSPLMSREIILFSFRNRIPLVGLSPSWTKAGALYSPAWDYRALGHQCAGLAETILREDPTERAGFAIPEKMHYTVNTTVAEKLRIILEPALIEGALEVY